MNNLKHTRENSSYNLLILMFPKLKLSKLPTRHRCIKDEKMKEIKCCCGENIIFVHYAFTLGHISTSVMYFLKIYVYMNKFYCYNSKSIFFPQTYVYHTKVIISELWQ